MTLSLVACMGSRRAWHGVSQVTAAPAERKGQNRQRGRARTDREEGPEPAGKRRQDQGGMKKTHFDARHLLRGRTSDREGHEGDADQHCEVGWVCNAGSLSSEKVFECRNTLVRLWALENNN